MLSKPRRVEVHKFKLEGKRFLFDVQRSISMEIEPIWDDLLDLARGAGGSPLGL